MKPPIDQIIHTKFLVKKGNPIPITIPIVVFILTAGAVFNGASFLFVIILSILCIALITWRQGVETNLTNMTYRDYNVVVGIRYGKFKSVGEPDYLLISKTLHAQKVSIGQTAISADFKDVLYDVDIITKGERDVLISRNYNRNKTVAFAVEVASDYDLKICEKTTEGLIWL